MSRKITAVAALALLLGGAPSAKAAVSPQDGFSPSGAPEWHFNLLPYLWLPSSSGEIVLGNGAQVDIDRGAPSLSELSGVLQAAFVGAALVRYGRWSGVIDIQYVSVSVNTGLPALVPGVTRNLDLDVSLVRIAPGIGYQLYNGNMGSSPATLDGRVGFSWLQTDESLKLSQTGPAGNTRISDLSVSNGFVQPWVGLEGAIYPSAHWRLELGVMVQGFGVSDGSWGWGASALATWAANDWLNLTFGYRALNTEREAPQSAVIRSLPNLTSYGPVAGIGFSF
jgi:hypothetical protein